MQLSQKNIISRKIAIAMALLMSFQAGFPTDLNALTSGPVAPELQSFEPIGSTEMVDLFSGDFTYNIPLMEIPGPDGGYPINLFYNSVTDGEQEASMVGLGWNIGIGAINRQVRGIPDDFDGEEIERKRDQDVNWTVGLGVSGGIADEIFGIELKNTGYTKGFSLGATLMYNSYRGFGYSFDPRLSTPLNTDRKNELSIDFGFSLNTLDGPTFNAGFSFEKLKENVDKNDIQTTLGLGVTMSGRQGADVNLRFANGRARQVFKQNGRVGNLNTYDNDYAGPGGLINFPLTYSQPSYAQSSSLQFSGNNLDLNFKVGAGAVGTFNDIAFSGFYNEQKLVNKNKWAADKAYGYMYAQNATGTSLKDFTREKENTITKQIQNLAMPSTQPDVISVVGHGIGGTYHTNRSDVGVLTDQVNISSTVGGSAGLEYGPGVPIVHTGTEIGINASTSGTYVPSLANGMTYGYASSMLSDKFEPAYFKRAGELTASYPDDQGNYDANIARDEVIRLAKDSDKKLELTNQLIRKNNETVSIGDGKRTERDPRSMSIQSLTNKNLLDLDGIEVLPEYKVKYYQHDDSDNISYTQKRSYDRTENSKNQIAGFTNVTTNGARWVFGLPVINHTTEEAIFSVDAADSECQRTIRTIPKDGDGQIDHKRPGTDGYLDITKTPAHANAYLLTSILGNDYIDTDINDGPPNDLDRGYWMQIEYVRTNDKDNPYAWRTPFIGATRMPGLNNKKSDDKATFTYGGRDQYYPAKISSRTHEAVFHYAKRADARGAANKINNADLTTNEIPDTKGAYSYKLEKIELFAKQSGVTKPIKTVHFNYDDSQIGLNTPNAEVGKLLLKNVHFTYEENTRGSLSPYKFTYNGGDNKFKQYTEYAQDRWGVYKDFGTDVCGNYFDPFVDQEEASQETINGEIRSHHLTKINLPSGSEINLEFERDHYSHVQDRVATQMFEITGVGEIDSDMIDNSAYGTTDEEFKIYFKPEGEVDDVEQYISDLYEDDNGIQVKFSLYSDIFQPNKRNPERVYGYMNLTKGETKIGYDNGNPFILVNPNNIEVKKGEYYHPFLLANWQFLRSNLPEFIYDYNLGDKPRTGKEKRKKAFALLGNLVKLGQAFRNQYSVFKQKEYGSKIHLDKSYIRLNSPDKKKYGGGVRVKQVTLSDNWSHEDTPIYGTVYDYDTPEVIRNEETGQLEPTGRMISSGVAANEPYLGKEASALTYATQYAEDARRTDNLRFSEMPVNESYMPGASVGYGKVTVKSLASAYASDRSKNPYAADAVIAGKLEDLEGFAISGATEHDFYTYKDFPVVTDQTTIDKYNNPNGFTGVPGIFVRKRELFTASQGYKIELNNMHGQQKKVTNYAQTKEGILNSDPISYVEYQYKSKKESYKRGNKWYDRNVLDNQAKVLFSTDKIESTSIKGAFNSDIRDAELGVSREVFTSLQQNATFRAGFNPKPNLELSILGGISIPMLGVSEYISDVNISVTNKVIRKSAILDKVIAKDGQSIVTTENLVFDPLTGEPLLTSVNNNFDNKIYNLAIPGYMEYPTMGPAYKNTGYEFTAFKDVVEIDCTGLYELDGVGSDERDMLIPGDEFIVTYGIEDDNGDEIHGKTRATFIEICTSGKPAFYIENPDNLPLDSDGSLDFYCYRSGNRNLLSAKVANITALVDPTQNLVGNDANNATVAATDGSPTSVAAPSYNMQDVLNASANTFSDAWDLDKQACNDVMDEEEDGNCRCLSLTTNSLIDLDNNVERFGQPISDKVFIEIEVDGQTYKYIETDRDNLEQNYLDEENDRYLFECGWNNESSDIRIIVGIEYFNSVNGAGIFTIPYNGRLTEEGPFCQPINTCPDNPSVDNLYRTGEKGIWRPHQSYTFVADREEEQSDESIAGAGIVSEVPMFNFTNPFFLQSPAADKWRLTDEITKYTNNESAVESKNILGQHSAALYGYRDNLATAVAANAKFYEIGYEGFEQFIVPKEPVPVPQIRFSVDAIRPYSISNGTSISNNCSNGNGPLIEIDFSWENWELGDNITFTIQAPNDGPGGSFTVNSITGSYTMRLNISNSSSLCNSTGVYTVDSGNKNQIASFKQINFGSAFSPPTIEQFTYTEPGTGNEEDPLLYRLGLDDKTPAGFELGAYINDDNHIDLYCAERCETVTETYNILGGWNKNSEIYLDRPIGNGNRVPEKITLFLKDEEGNDAYMKLNVSAISAYDPVVVGIEVPFTQTLTKVSMDLSSNDLDRIEDALYSGRAVLQYCNEFESVNCESLMLTTKYAHTGRRSLMVSDGSSVFEQKSLKLHPGKEYVLGAWVRRNAAAMETYADNNLGIVFQGQLFQPSGPIIDGWQRIEGKFIASGTNPTMQFAVGSSEAYFDDIRIFPQKGNIQTYVYDQLTYRVTEVLDNNNFFTRYIYNSEGSLISTQKETYRGVKTIQEAGSYIVQD